MYSKINVKQSFSDFILYIFPSVVTMVLVSFYSAIDSWFLAQYVSTNAMAAINIVLPYSNLIWGLAVMFTCGSCALHLNVLVSDGIYGNFCNRRLL